MEFKHPNYYKELRKRNKELQAATLDLAGAQSDQVISKQQATASSTRAPGPGLKLDVPAPAGPSVKPQASSSKLRYTPTGILLGVDLGDKPQASSSKPQATKSQAASDKHQA